MVMPGYPREIWRGHTTRSSHVYRAVVADARDTIVFEMYQGKDAMQQDRWRTVSKDGDGDEEAWPALAAALATAYLFIKDRLPEVKS